jgi:NDP-sugar pyrophosphorylase family protein
VNSFANVENAVILPRVDVGRSSRLKNVVIDAEVKIPEGLVVGEDPELDAKRFRRTERGVCLITQPMIDRLADQPSLHRVPERVLTPVNGVEEDAEEDRAINGLDPEAAIEALEDEAVTSGLKA